MPTSEQVKGTASVACDPEQPHGGPWGGLHTSAGSREASAYACHFVRQSIQKKRAQGLRLNGVNNLHCFFKHFLSESGVLFVLNWQ